MAHGRQELGLGEVGELGPFGPAFRLTQLGPLRRRRQNIPCCGLCDSERSVGQRQRRVIEDDAAGGVGDLDMAGAGQVLQRVEQGRQCHLGRHAAQGAPLGPGDGGKQGVLDGQAVEVAFQRQMSLGHVVVRPLQQSDGLALFQVKGHEPADRFQFGDDTIGRRGGFMVQAEPSVERPAGAKRYDGIPFVDRAAAAGYQAEAAGRPITSEGGPVGTGRFFRFGDFVVEAIALEADGMIDFKRRAGNTGDAVDQHGDFAQACFEGGVFVQSADGREDTAKQP